MSSPKPTSDLLGAAPGVQYIFYGLAEPDEEVPLHGGDTAWVLDLSPPCCKLRAYLLMTGYKEGVDYEWKNLGDPTAEEGYEELKKEKDKVPFVYIVKENRYMADGHLIIQMLESCKAPHQRLDNFLTGVDRAVARAFQVLCEDSLYWSVVVNERWIQEENFSDRLPLIYPLDKVAMFSFMSSFIYKDARDKVLEEAKGHGMGRHNQAEQVSIAVEDLGHLSEFLADKAYMFGGRPCMVDLAVYALLVNAVVNAYVFKPQNSMASQQVLSMSNLMAYLNRMSKLLKTKRAACYTRTAPYPLPLPKWGTSPTV